MKKTKMISLVLITVFVFGCRQGEEVCSEKYDESGQLEAVFINLNDEDNHSLHIKFYPGGGIKEHYYVKQDTLNGRFTSFFEDGQIEHQEYQQSGLLEGRVMDYYPSGEVEQISNFKKGLLHGNRSYYRKDGKVKAVDTYFEGLRYFDRIWEYTGDSVATVNTWIEPVIQRRRHDNPDSLVLIFRLPLDDLEFVQEYLRMNAGISTWTNGALRDSAALTDVRFENDIYEYDLHIESIDSITIWALIQYDKPTPEIEIDTFHQGIILDPVREGDSIVHLPY